ncbi:hypothetical protein EC973_008287 [Apophysomyces ossiformis]|uniref:BRCC36 C-terminal helical domain-containing protein n=1 Tax=Apophysomyces ossiformis TaxID=679940 RepID=A0A8H7ETV8_9FUNG|nr:hypothetical protein EC973_008287 [Apophysomyces ossiformis]
MAFLKKCKSLVSSRNRAMTAEIRPASPKSLPRDYEEILILPSQMYEEHKTEYELASGRIQWEEGYSTGTDGSYLGSRLTQLYNAGVYGQSITHLVDNVICPATQQLELKTCAVQQEIELLKQKKERLLENESELLDAVDSMQDCLIQLDD